MSEAQHTVQETPAVTSATTEPTAASTTATATAAQATADPVRPTETSTLAPESRPEVASAVGGTTAAAPSGPNVTNASKEETVGKGQTLIESKAILEGTLNYKGPGLKGLIFSKKFFWFSDEPLEHSHLAGYLSSEKSKDIAHPNAAHATQTGKGLLFYAKRAEDKHHPQGILNLADMSDVVRVSFNEFSIMLHGHKHTFQALNKSERDGWLMALEPKMAESKTSRESIVGGAGYKSQLEKYGKPTTAGTTNTSRSLSRPKKASKSQDRSAAISSAAGTTPATTTGTAADTTTATTTGTAADTTATTGASTVTPADTTTGATKDHHHGAEAVAGTAAGAAVVGASARKGSTSDDDKAKNQKSRSQSRGKRSSIFGGLLAKKEEHGDKKAIKKEEKEEKKEEKAEDKAVKQEVKKEAKIEKKEEKHLEKDLKHDHAGKAGDLDAAAVAARVVGAPVVPAAGHTTGVAETTPVTAGETSTAAETTPTSATQETAPKNKRNSIFGSLFGKKDAASPTATSTSTAAETAPVVPAKDEPSTVSTTAPQLEHPVTAPITTEGTAASTSAAAPVGATTETAAPVTDSTSPTTGTTTSPTDKRRTSFFGNLGNKKEKRTGGTSGDELTDGESKKQSSSGFGGLLRKASRAQPKGTSSAAATETADVPLPKETPAAPEPTTNGETAAAEKPDLAAGEIGSNAIAKHEQTPVQATA